MNPMKADIKLPESYRSMFEHYLGDIKDSFKELRDEHETLARVSPPTFHATKHNLNIKNLFQFFGLAWWTLSLSPPVLMLRYFLKGSWASTKVGFEMAKFFYFRFVHDVWPLLDKVNTDNQAKQVRHQFYLIKYVF